MYPDSEEAEGVHGVEVQVAKVSSKDRVLTPTHIISSLFPSLISSVSPAWLKAKNPNTHKNRETEKWMRKKTKW